MKALAGRDPRERQDFYEKYSVAPWQQAQFEYQPPHLRQPHGPLYVCMYVM